MLIATTVRGTRSIERQLAELETIRSILVALPDRDQLAVGSFSGERADHPHFGSVGSRYRRAEKRPCRGVPPGCG